MIKQLILVGLGGGTGSILRYLTSVATAKFFNGGFPLATFIANIVGCAILGISISAFGKNIVENDSLKLLLLTGFCGGYTTFSTFAVENIYFLQQQNYVLLVIYTVLSLFVGFCAVYLGLNVAKTW